MPPKKKGQTLMRKQKVFRHAVEYVRLGLGHTVLGNLNLGLAVSSSGSTETTIAATVQRPAFYVELNEQLLSHSSKDFKKFRWEVLELCETAPLFHLHHRQLAQKLLARLMDRGTNHVGDEESDVTKVDKKARRKQCGGGGGADVAPTQAYEAFARLTIAFVHDMGSKFLPYYQIFQQAMQAGMYDQNGYLIVDTARLQLVFAVQAAWCRELRNCWADPAHLPLVRRIIRQYVGQLHDTKEYVRRLSAELLAFLCRLCRPLLPLIVEEACADVLRYYEETAIANTDSDGNAEGSGAEEHDSCEDEQQEEEEEAEEDDGAAKSLESPSSSIWTDATQLLDFTRNTLPHHPVVDGLTFFAAELFRGVRGALSSSFETHYVRLLYAFQLMELDEATAAPARSTVSVVRALHQQRHPLAPLLDAASDDDENNKGSPGDARGTATAPPLRCRRSGDMHSTRWSTVFGSVSETETDVHTETAAAQEEKTEESATLGHSGDIDGARRLLRCIGSLTLGNAMATVLRETKKQFSFMSTQRESSAEEEDDDGGGDETAAEDETGGASSAHSSVRPSHRVLTAVVLCFNPATSPATAAYVQLFISIMGAVNFSLWKDSREASLLKQLAAQLLSLLRTRTSTKNDTQRQAASSVSSLVVGENLAMRSLETAAAVLRLVSPLCLSPYLGASSKTAAASAYLLQLQQWFVPVAKAAVQACVKVATTPPKGTAEVAHSSLAWQLQEEAEQILFAFAQDVAQKNYAFAIEAERRVAEETDVHGVSGPGGATTSTAAASDSREDAYVSSEEEEGWKAGGAAAAASNRPHAQEQRPRHHTPSFLTPFALTVLHAIGVRMWQRAAEDLQCISNAAATATASLAVEGELAMTVACRHANVQRAVLLSRLLQDHTQHMSVSPLQQLLRLKPVSTTESSSNSNSGSPAAGKVVFVRDVLERLVLLLLQHYKITQRTGHSHREAANAMSYVSCALPLIQLLVSTPTAATTSVSAQSCYPVKSALLELLHSIEEREKPASGTVSLSSVTEAPSSADDMMLDPAAYALYAEVAAMLVQLTASPSTHRRKSKSKKSIKSQSETASSSVTPAETEQEGLRHLCRTVAVLARGFRQLRVHPKTANAAEAAEAAEAAATVTASAATVSDDARVQLLHGAEVLLHALLWMLGLDSKSQRNGHDDAQAFHPAASPQNGFLSAHTRTALRTLHTALPVALHTSFVEHVLLECLTAPIAGLRLHALRLLRLLCHPALDEADRLVGAPAVPLEILDALLRAAEFNPLSHTGNLDGMQQILSRLSFKVESGAIRKPFERVLIARTMIGFLYIKFTGAWETASKLLCWLVAQEDTTMPVTPAAQKEDNATSTDSDDESSKDGKEDDTRGEVVATQPRRVRLEPVVWNTVICVYARALVLGDVVTVAAATASSGAPAGTKVQRAKEEEEEVNDGDETADANAGGSAMLAVVSCSAQLAQLPCLYEIRLTDQQRHAKGELVCRAFSSTQYSTSSFTLLECANDDFEVVRWGQHWTTASSSLQQQTAGSEVNPNHHKKGHRDSNSSPATAALYATSTDRSTLAQTFLSIVETMVKLSSAVDRKVRLVEDVVLELVAVERNRHPSGIDASQVRRLDQRLVLALQACAAAPTSVFTAHQRERVSEAALQDFDSRNAELQAIFVSYLSEANPGLQRGAVDNLKRLRVEPYYTYHAKLIPYCDTMKSLFAFLSTFHVESDIPAHDRVSYISAALSLALPKLLTKVSKDKLKDQAVLSRRLMGYLEHLPTQPARGSGVAKDPLAEVFDQLLHRLLSFAMPVASTTTTAATATSSFSSDQVDSYNFLINVWEEVVYYGCGRRPPSAQRSEAAASAAGGNGSEVSRRFSLHGIRRLERLMKQLSSALRLLEAMLHTVGQRFSVYVSTCLHVALQAYLVACKQCLRCPVDALAATLSTPVDGVAQTPEEERVRRWVAFLNKSLASSALSSALSHVRRAAVSIVALLSEQFPEEVMEAVRGDDVSNRSSRAVSSFPLFAKYLQMLFDNSKGTTLEGGRGILGKHVPSAAKSSVTPVLRLLTAWVRSPVLLPLFPAFAPIVVGTLDEVFAVSATAASVTKASSQAVYDGLRCVSEMLSCADDVVEELQVQQQPAQRAAVRKAAPTTRTFRECFLEQHIIGVFAALYRLLTFGAAREEAAATNTTTTTSVEPDEAAATAPVANPKEQHEQRLPSSKPSRKRKSSTVQRDSKQRPTSIMSLSISMWREVMRTVSQLTRFLHTDAAASPSSLVSMVSRLLELALKMVAHPVCTTDASTAQMVTGVALTLMEQVPTITYREHWQPLVRLFNVVPNPQARHSLCAILSAAVGKLPATERPFSPDPQRSDGEVDVLMQEKWFRAQLEAAARAVRCLNSFEDENTFDRYDFELRYHTLHSLHDFFAHFGNYGALQRCRHGSGEADGSAIRKERMYDGAEDVQLPLDKDHAPVLAPEAVAVLAANVMFFLRDPEQTIRALVLPLLQSMVRYASWGGQRPSGASEGRGSHHHHAKRRAADHEAGAELREPNDTARAAHQAYRTQLLESTLRHEVLGSLRRGVVAKDVHIRCAHMQAFEGFARYFSGEFPSFALLYSPNTEQNFYANVGHVQHRCRLHALGLLRQHAAEMHVRDILRVFVPFAMSAVKDFAEGKRNQANLTEGRARGYCDAVLLTISSIAARLPWTAYYRVLSLFLSNASANANLRATMLRGVVQVLNNFHFLQDSAADGEEAEEANVAVDMGESDVNAADNEEDEVNDADDAVRAELAAKQREFRHAKVMRVLEADVLPQLYSYIGDKDAKSVAGKGLTNQHSITAVRREQQREDAASAQMKNALLQLPVAMAITKIVKHFPEDRFNVHVDHLLDELIKKLRTKNDKHRDSARRILGAMLQETGPSKLKFVVTKLKDNLVHGYQLHVLGYTVVTLLYQLYEPNSQLLHPHTSKPVLSAVSGTHARGDGIHDPVQEALEEAKMKSIQRSRKEKHDANVEAPPARRARLESKAEGEEEEEKSKEGAETKAVAVDEDTAVEQAEEALLRELGTSVHAQFDFQYGVDCLTGVLEDLLLIFLDDYLGEVGVQKEQVEMMSTMVEVKRNRALQGFVFLGKHCDAATVMEAFLQRINWVLTPPADSAVSVSELHGSARARALLVQEMKNKYLTVGKNGSVDLVFVNKVRLLAVRVARSLMTNPTMSVEKSFEQVRRLLDQHNRTREEKVSAFEAKDGTRRIRGNAHLILHKADRHSRKEQLDQNFLVAPVPERVDVDFSAHTVLATQQKQKLRVYRGRYGKEVKEAAKNFYREDPVTAVVLDTLDEFLLKFLLSVLKQVLGIGKEKRYSKAAMKLDMLRHHREQQQKKQTGGDEGDDEDEVDAEEEQLNSADDDAKPDENDEEDEEDVHETTAIENEDGDEDGLGAFAEAQTVAEGDVTASAAASTQRTATNNQTHKGAAVNGSGDGGGGRRSNKDATTTAVAALLAPGSDLTVTFTREHRGLLESLVPVVLACLQGEGSDAVVANALDCLLALVSLRPPLNAINDLQKELFETVTSFIERGSVIKQRAIRLTAAMVAHQKYVVSEANAVQLVKLVRAEVMERNEFMPVSLSLLYAVLGKHVHIAEIYDLMDIITELLLHWSARRVIRRRCILILTRFLLEYRLTPEKFRSHIDMYCRNLDYPELTGRTALLELLDALIVRLPAVILRDEAPALLVPLAATVTGSEWVECRRQGGTVLQHLARYAGVDVLVPVLSAWMAAAQPRATRSMAVQTWATILPALSEFYELDAASQQQQQQQGDDGDDEDTVAAREQNRAAFQACCAWSVEAVLEGCLYDQLAASGRNKKLDQLSAKAKEKVELGGWAYVFYSLRAAEAMLTALPGELYPLLAPRLLPHVTGTLMVHTHPWVRAAATRILRHYLYTFAESRCHYLQEEVWQQLANDCDILETVHHAATGSHSDTDDALLYVFSVAAGGEEGTTKSAVADAMKTLQTFASLLKRILGLVSASDVAMETYNAHRAIADPTRGELLKIATYVLRAMAGVSLFALTQTYTAATALAAATAPVAHFQRRLRIYKDVQQRVRLTYVALQHQLHSLIAPVVQQNSLVNYMVRSATLLQLLGGWISVLPHEMAAESNGEENDGDEDAEAPQPLYDAYNAQVRWMTQQLLCPTAMLQQCALPFLGLGLRAKPISEKISLIAYQVTAVVEQQLEDRRHELTSPASTQASATAVDVHEPVGKKRRLDNGKKEAGEFGVEDSHGVPLDDVLISLKTQLANVHDARRDQQVVRNTKKALKRSRRQMELESKQQGRGRRPSSSQGQTGVTLPKTKNSTSARKPHHGSV